MNDKNKKEIRFDIWCPTCSYKDVKDYEGEEPCNECLEKVARKATAKPIKYKKT